MGTFVKTPSPMICEVLGKTGLDVVCLDAKHSPFDRLVQDQCLQALRAEGIRAGVLVAPVIPGLTDQELPAILKAAAEAGAEEAGYIALRLPHAVAPLFEQWLETHRPLARKKVMDRIRSMREGKVNQAEFGTRMKGSGFYADQIASIFKAACHKHGLNRREQAPLNAGAFRRPGEQLSLF